MLPLRKSLRLLFFILTAGIFLSACVSSPAVQKSADGSQVNFPLFSNSIDLKKAVLTPTDVKDIFDNASTSLLRNDKNNNYTGIQVIYPTEQIEHTDAFAKGFSTEIRVYKQEQDAVNALNTFVSAQKGTNGKEIKVKELANKTIAYQGPILTTDGSTLPGNEYHLLIQARNIFIHITLRTDRDVSAQNLEALGQTVLSRLDN
jgi:hypothetical protein